MNDKDLLTKPGEIFLCSRCMDAMCEDCISIADEYQYRDGTLKRAAYQAEDELKKAQTEIKRLQRSAEQWENIAKLGYSDVIQQWMDWEVNNRTKETTA
jgi:formate hydrogenlyase subunit 6/NADH:ubiquinone oxidoreductase subunit I